MINSTSGAVTSFDASNTDSAVTVGLETLIPPSFVGRTSRSLSTVEHAWGSAREDHFLVIESSSG